MYYPYFRGKQYELILLRDRATFLRDQAIRPIVEPVRSNLSSLSRAIGSLNEANTDFVLVTNPHVGELQSRVPRRDLEELLGNSPNGSLGIIVDRLVSVEEVVSWLSRRPNSQHSIIHGGSSNGRELAQATSALTNVREHVFLENPTGKLYQRNFREAKALRVLVRDAFKTRKNADYDESEHFSDLHVMYEDEGMDGFGDYLIVGEEYSDTGGPAYAVAIHITYIDPATDDMFIYHFKSRQNSSPSNPAGKFMEALELLVSKLNDPDANIFDSGGCQQFVSLYNKQHFPGLGKVKQICMEHHLELIADFLGSV